MTTNTDRAAGEVRYRRFDRTNRILHGFLMLSFLGLAFTGLPLLFSEAPWAGTLAGLLGGPHVTADLHRICAAVMIGTFGTHLFRIFSRLLVEKDYGVLWGPRSMVPQPRDLHEFVGHLKFFLGLGPRPLFDRYTYWEKFDYWAVFWGMGIIGGSGLLLWFPAFFGRFLPGWSFNVALLVHGEEALLAVTFIFTVHFFNGHLRPEKFPMDTVIFTGCVPEDELAHERPSEWERLNREGGLDGIRTGTPKRRVLLAGRAIGTVAVLLGLTMVTMTIYAFLTHQ